MEKGFTLIELIVVIIIFVILAAIAVPTWHKFQARQRLKGAGYEMLNDFLYCKVKAIENGNCTINIFPTGYSIATGNQNINKNIDQLFKGIIISFTTNQLKFNRSGFIDNITTEQIYTLSNPNNNIGTISIKVNKLGKVSLSQ